MMMDAAAPFFVLTYYLTYYFTYDSSCDDGEAGSHRLHHAHC